MRKFQSLKAYLNIFIKAAQRRVVQPRWQQGESFDEPAQEESAPEAPAQDDFPSTDSYDLPAFDDMFQDTTPQQMTEEVFQSMPTSEQKDYIKDLRRKQRTFEKHRDIEPGFDDYTDLRTIPKELEVILEGAPDLRDIVYTMLTHHDEDTVRDAKKKFNDLPKPKNSPAKAVAEWLKEDRSLNLKIDEEEQMFQDLRDQFLRGLEKEKASRKGISSGTDKEMVTEQTAILLKLKEMAEKGVTGAREFVDKIPELEEGSIGDGDRFTQFMDSSNQQMEDLKKKRDEKSKAEREEHERVVQEFLARKNQGPDEVQKSREKLRTKREDDKKKEEFSKLSLTERDAKVKEIQNGLKLIVQKKRSEKPMRDVLPDGSKWIAMDKKGPWFLIRPGHGDKFKELYGKYMELMKLMREA